MYIPEYFKITDNKKIHAFIQEHAFGQLISKAEGRLFSTHLPFLLSQDKTKLLGHIAKQNPQGKDIDNQEALVTLQGAHNYISPTWCSNPSVPTWNYQAVHIYGQCKTFNEPSKLKQIIEELTHKYESQFEDKWKPEYNELMLHAIVGVEITITEIQCKFKLSQNRSTQDQEEIIANLTANNIDELAEAMKKNIEPL